MKKLVLRPNLILILPNLLIVLRVVFCFVNIFATVGYRPLRKPTNRPISFQHRCHL